MVATFKTLVTYLKNPEYTALQDVSNKEKLVTTLKILAIGFCFSLTLGIVSGIVAQDFIDMDKHASKDLLDKYTPVIIFLLAAVLAPITEELMFRAPLYFFRNNTKYFKYIFYGFALVFGYVHLFNFEITTNAILLSPLLVAPQIILGLFLGYLRVKLGLLYAILLHMLYNGILTLPLFFVP